MLRSASASIVLYRFDQDSILNVNEFLPAIVIPCFKRTYELSQLLNSVANGTYPSDNIALLFVADGNASPEVIDLVNGFEWEHGVKKLIKQDKQLGLEENLKYCGRLSQEFGAVLILEDDSFVSPGFYLFAQSALNKYADDENIAGISLYRYEKNQVNCLPHCVGEEQYDVFFMQKTGTHGVVFTNRQWTAFENWLSQTVLNQEVVPYYIKRFGLDNWEFQHNAFMIENDLYMVYPLRSLSTNTGAVGVHQQYKIDANFYQSELRRRFRRFNFVSLAESNFVYDAYGELLPDALKRLLPENSPLLAYDFDCDLTGYKQLSRFQKPFVLSIRAKGTAELSYSHSLKPPELNLIWNMSGTELRLVKREKLLKHQKSELTIRARQYWSEVDDIGWIRFVLFKILKHVDRIKSR